MDSLSHDDSAGDIANQMVNIGSGGLESGASAVASLTGLIPAGAEEVSMQAAMAFATEGAQMLASNVAAQTELMNAGMALLDIAKSYGNLDEAAADTLGLGAASHAAAQLAGRSAASLAGLAGAGSVHAPGLSSAAAAAPLLANFAEAPVGTGAAGAGGAAGALGNAANIGSTALGAGTAPLGALQGAQGGSSRPGMPASLVDDTEQSDPNDEQLPGERRL
ncbi:PE family protein [Mycobacterium sp.]|uniref:PE family protein n=1 Tax=Mycobacterium sp. TaxID=1785 RepID=UPI002CE4C2B2|nr:PE family protein [Mycobacterium sp.]HTQ18305.1 PE family protein [Mycobacterium sp.]